MNNLTKEELIKIHELLVFACSYAEPDSTYELKDKLQSLIDNYCEHEIYYDYDDCADYCKKCGKKIAVDRRLNNE